MGHERREHTISRRGALFRSLLAAGGVALGGCARGAGGGGSQSGAGAGVASRVKPLRIAHLTDMHVLPQRRAAEGYAAALRSLAGLDPRPDFIVTGGDHVFDTLKQPRDVAVAQWDLYDRVLAENTKLPVYPVLGNHDIWGWSNPEQVASDAPLYGKAMGLDRLKLAKPYYGFDAGPWHVIVLDSMSQQDRTYVGDLGPEQREWLKSELESVGTTRPIAIFSHIPFVCVSIFFARPERLGDDGWNVPDSGMHRDMREIVDLLDPYNVPLLVSGHIHMVDRIDYRGMTFICDGSISGNWWRGPRLQFPEGYGVFDLYPDGRFDHRYVTYGWTAEV